MQLLRNMLRSLPMRNRSDITATVHLFKDAENLKAFADVTIKSRVGEITIRRFKIIAYESGKLWVALPQFEYKTLFDRHYLDSVVMQKRTLRRIQRVVLKKYVERKHQQKSRGQVDNS